MFKKTVTRLLIAILLVIQPVFLMTGCESRNVRKAKEEAAKIKIYGIKIVNAGRELYAEGKLSQSEFRVFVESAERFQNAVKALDGAIASAEAAKDKKGALNIIESIVNSDIAPAFEALVAAVLRSPSVVTSENINKWVEIVRIAISTIRTLISEVRQDAEVNYA
jgi:hypothetical protein